MRVLMTGFTRMHIGARTKTAVVQFAALMADALRDLGHEVEHRATAIGESLRSFDVVLVGISTVDRPAVNLYAGLDVIARARAEDCGLGFFVDDHKLGQIGETLRSAAGVPASDKPILVGGEPTLKRGSRLVKDFFSDRPNWEWARQNLPTLVAVGNAICNRPWPTTIIPAFTWADQTALVSALAGNPRGDHRQPFTIPHPVLVDPSSYAPEFPANEVAPEDRVREWVNAALPAKKHYEFPVPRSSLSWPVREYGTGKVVTEPAIFTAYERAWGVVANRSLRHAGSGWWRVRYVHSARAGAVLLTGPEDATRLPATYQLPAQEVEMLTSAALKELAQAQAEVFWTTAWTREQFREYLGAVIGHIREHESGPVPP